MEIWHGWNCTHGNSNRQVVLFLKRIIARGQTRVKNISGRYPSSLCVFNNQSYLQWDSRTDGLARTAWRAPEQCACDSKATGNLESRDERCWEISCLPERTSGMFLQWWGTPWIPWAAAICSPCPVLRSISAARVAGTRPGEVPWTLDTQPASPAPRQGQNSRRAWLWTSGYLFGAMSTTVVSLFKSSLFKWITLLYMICYNFSENQKFFFRWKKIQKSCGTKPPQKLSDEK